ncbi:MAG: thioredoxin domain-containing protein [Anaerolineae bacterium]|nr:thioredoxin domain-containing protein [Anaerolineae bacterium]MCI0608162.1 thioredoxin domain-containing protein [Anaerolineae bacterium]
MSQEKKSKRQERRERMYQRERRNRLLTIGIITIVAAFLVFAVVWPQIRPIAEVVSVEPNPRPNAERNTAGVADAPIKIEEFADFQCPFCERFFEQTEPLLIEHYVATGKVQFVYRSMGNFVSRNLGGARTESQDAAAAAYCAGDQGKFWEMHDALFANVLGEDVGSFTDRRLAAIAEKVGLDMTEFNECYNSGKYADQVQQDFEDGQAAGVNGTPGFVVTYTVNGETKTKLIEGAQPFSTFQQELEAILNEIGAASS